MQGGSLTAEHACHPPELVYVSGEEIPREQLSREPPGQSPVQVAGLGLCRAIAQSGVGLTKPVPQGTFTHTGVPTACLQP